MPYASLVMKWKDISDLLSDDSGKEWSNYIILYKNQYLLFIKEWFVIGTKGLHYIYRLYIYI